MKPLELRLLALFGACWLLGLLRVAELVPSTGLALSLYFLYGLAAALGWLAGNLYVHRSRALAGRARRWTLAVYLFGTPGITYLLWSLQQTALLWAAPLVPLYSFGVFAALFAVPVLVRPRPLAGRRPADRGEIDS